MKRLLYLTALTMVATLVMGSVALAQGVPPDGSPNRYGCPDGYPFVASDPDDPGEASLRCFATEEEAAAYSAGELVEEEPPVAEEPPTETQYETPETPTAPETPQVPETEPLPDTGGPAILLPVAGLLLAAGLVGMRVARRR